MNMPFDLLTGRKTFDIWAPYWPQHNDTWPAVNASDQVHRLEHHDFSRMAAVRVLKPITKIKQQEGPDLHVYGSANLVQTLLKHDLVDAFWLKIFPITLGGGKRLFSDGTIPAAFAAFKVTESRVTSKGVIIVNYERAGAVPTERL